MPTVTVRSLRWWYTDMVLAAFGTDRECMIDYWLDDARRSIRAQNYVTRVTGAINEHA